MNHFCDGLPALSAWLLHWLGVLSSLWKILCKVIAVQHHSSEWNNVAASPPPAGESFCSHSEQCPVSEVSSGKALQGSSSAEERSSWNAEWFFALTGLIFQVSASLLSNEVNSSRRNILKFFLHKSSRGIQDLVLKYQGWNLKRSFYYFGGFPGS